MKRFKLLSILMVCIFVMSGCSSGSNHANDKELPKEDHAKEITIEVQDYNTNFYVNAAKKFEEETGVKVNVINDYKGQSVEDLYAITERIQAELMAGKGADLYANANLDYAGIGKNKHLCNLANWIDDEPSISNDIYYMNILKSGFNEGDVYSIPLFMDFVALWSTIEVPGLEGKSFDWEGFMEFSKGIKRNGVLYAITDQMLFDRRFLEKYNQYIDEKNKIQNLNSSDMVKLLEQCKEWSKEGVCIPCEAENFAELANKAIFIDGGGSDMDRLVNFRFNNPNLKNQNYYYDIPSDSGKDDKSNKVLPSDIICINAASPYKGTAWKFVKFLLREDIQATGFFTPVNRNAADKHVKKYLDDIKSYYKLKFDANRIIKESKAILDSIDEGADNANKTEIESIILKESKRFFTNEITAEAAAKNMEDRVKLYFKEQ